MSFCIRGRLVIFPNRVCDVPKGRRDYGRTCPPKVRVTKRSELRSEEAQQVGPGWLPRLGCHGSSPARICCPVTVIRSDRSPIPCALSRAFRLCFPFRRQRDRKRSEPEHITVIAIKMTLKSPCRAGRLNFRHSEIYFGLPAMMSNMREPVPSRLTREQSTYVTGTGSGKLDGLLHSTVCGMVG